MSEGAAEVDRPGVLVYGASGGIGSALCTLLSAERRVVAAGRDVEALARLRDRIGCEVVPIENPSVAEMERVASLAVEKVGALDGIANCIGSLLLKPAHLTSEQEWNETLQINLGSAFGCIRAAAATMRGKGGAVVLVSSAAARTGLANHDAIAAAKAGVLGLVLSSSASYARQGIRVNAVAPGLVRTPLTTRITSNETAARGSTAMHAAGRLGEPEDVARMMAWLLDPEQTWVTGQCFGVDGGLATVRSR